MHTVEHVTYQAGGKFESEEAFALEREARLYGLHALQRHGGRIWIDGKEYNVKELAHGG